MPGKIERKIDANARIVSQSKMMASETEKLSRHKLIIARAFLERDALYWAVASSLNDAFEAVCGAVEIALTI